MHLVFADANVLYSRTLRDWTLMLGQECERFAVISSRECIDEALVRFRDDNPAVDGGVVRQIRDNIENALHDIVNDWAGGEIAGMPDSGDWHIVHAARHAQVDVLVTDNIKDFVPLADELPFDVYSPDEMLTLVARNDPSAVSEVTRRQVQYWGKVRERNARDGRPAPKGLVQALRDAGAAEFSEVVDATLRMLSGSPERSATAGGDSPAKKASATSAPQPSQSLQQ